MKITRYPASVVALVIAASGLVGSPQAAAQSSYVPRSTDPSGSISRLKQKQEDDRVRQNRQRGFPAGKDGSFLRPVIGVVLVPDTQAGVRVGGVTPGSGAAKAGLKPGDRIVKINGREILGNSDEIRLDNAQRLLSGLTTQSPVEIGYMRGGKAATARVTPQIHQPVYVMQEDGTLLRANGNVQMARAANGGLQVVADNMDVSPAQSAPAEIREEIIRIGPGHGCKGKDCKAPVLMSAFRWNGLNLASVDAQLGRYFGTDHGVLVLSSGDLTGLQAGDVLQRVDGKPVTSPREVMAALRGKPDGAKIAVDYLRDRKSGTARITVPKLMEFPLPPLPPAPPAPPAAPNAPPPPPPPAPPKPA